MRWVDGVLVAVLLAPLVQASVQLAPVTDAAGTFRLPPTVPLQLIDGADAVVTLNANATRAWINITGATLGATHTQALVLKNSGEASQDFRLKYVGADPTQIDDLNITIGGSAATRVHWSGSAWERIEGAPFAVAAGATTDVKIVEDMGILFGKKTLTFDLGVGPTAAPGQKLTARVTLYIDP